MGNPGNPTADHLYCAYFCEENVWQLCRSNAADIPTAGRRAVFISNALKQVAMRHQRAGRGGMARPRPR